MVWPLHLNFKLITAVFLRPEIYELDGMIFVRLFACLKTELILEPLHDKSKDLGFASSIYSNQPWGCQG